MCRSSCAASARGTLHVPSYSVGVKRKLGKLLSIVLCGETVIYVLRPVYFVTMGGALLLAFVWLIRFLLAIA